MNQRSKRARDRKKQDLNSATMHTGGHLASHSRKADPVVRTPQKATGDVPAEKIKGLAKASPFFKKVKEALPKSKAEEKKVIAEATETKVTEEKASKGKEVTDSETEDAE